jgi:hypothetical protein
MFERIVPLELIACGSAEARTRFPQLPDGELAVIGDQGDVWFGSRVSKVLGLRDEFEIQRYLREVTVPGCEIGRT